ncbi:hypothetical protein ABKV19_013145 [Rosa sericea]
MRDSTSLFEIKKSHGFVLSFTYLIFETSFPTSLDSRQDKDHLSEMSFLQRDKTHACLDLEFYSKLVNSISLQTRISGSPACGYLMYDIYDFQFQQAEELFQVV